MSICVGYIVINQLFLYRICLRVISNHLNINTFNF